MLSGTCGFVCLRIVSSSFCAYVVHCALCLPAAPLRETASHDDGGAIYALVGIDLATLRSAKHSIGCLGALSGLRVPALVHARAGVKEVRGLHYMFRWSADDAHSTDARM